MLISNKIAISKNDKYYSEILNWCKSTLILDNPEYEKKLRMGLWLGKTPKKIYLYEENQDSLVLPFGAATEMCKYYSTTDIYTDFAHNEPISIEGSINLYDYQQIALVKLLKARNGVLISPAGSGKTQIGIALIKELGLKTLWLTHTSDLLSQSRDRFKEYCAANVGTITGGKVNIGDVTFATVQTLCKLDLPLYAYEWDLIIVDECHKIATVSQLSMFCKVLNNLKCRHKYGLTATYHRSDGMERGITAMLGDVIHEVPRSDVSERTVNPCIKKIELPTPKSFAYADTDGTLNFTKLVTYLANDAGRVAQIVAHIAESPGCSQLVLSDRLDGLKAILAALNDIGLGDIAVMIDGSMVSKQGKANREQAIEDMRSGKKKILLASYSLSKEGLDIPILSRLHLTTPVKDKAVVIQSVGRISRTCEDKPDAVVYDYLDREIGYCQNAFKKRCSHYKHINCRILK